MIPLSTSADEQEMLTACYRGDPTAQHRLYQTHYAFARTVALHYGGNSDEVEDIVQDAYIKLFVKLRAEPFAGPLKPFFRRIVANQAIDHYRRRSRRRTLLERWWPQQDEAEDNAAERELEADDVVHFLRQLSPRYRMVFSLHVLEGFTHTEIAERLSITPGTSKSNLAKARRKLAKLAGPYFSTPCK
jgi:RNA polymerase sigma-70 factor (ECF subfamily)